MNHALNTLRRRTRPLIIGLMAVTVFLLAFGTCCDRMPVGPRMVITAPESCALVGFDATGNALLTRRFTLDEQGTYLQAWDVATGTAIPLPELNVAELKGVSMRYPDGAKDGLIHFGAPVGPVLRAVLGDMPHYNMAFSPDRTFVSFPEPKMGDEPWRVGIWDVKADRKSASLATPGTGSWPMALAPGGRLMAYFDHDPQAKTLGYSTLVVFDLVTQREVLRAGGSGVRPSVEFAPDGTRVACPWSGGGDAHMVKLLNTETGAEVLAADDAGSFAFSSDSRFLVTHPAWNQSRFHLDVWDCRSGRHSARIRPFAGYRPDELCIRTCAAVPQSVLVLHSATIARGQNRELEEPYRPPLHLLRFIDMEAGRIVGSIQQKDAWGFTAICPLGKTLATLPSSAAGKEIHLYDLPPRRALGLYVLIASLSALVCTVLAWWCTRPRRATYERAAGFSPAVSAPLPPAAAGG